MAKQNNTLRFKKLPELPADTPKNCEIAIAWYNDYWVVQIIEDAKYVFPGSPYNKCLRMLILTAYPDAFEYADFKEMTEGQFTESKLHVSGLTFSGAKKKAKKWAEKNAK